MFWFLVACGVPSESADSAAETHVTVGPLSLSIQLEGGAMDCQDGDFHLYESMGFVYVVNDSDAPIQIDVYATHTGHDVYLPDPEPGTAPWMDVSVIEDTHRNLEPGGQMNVELYAMGRCYDVGEAVFDRATPHPYTVEVLVANEPTLVQTEIRLDPPA